MSNKEQNTQNETIAVIKKYAIQVVILVVAIGVAYYIGSLSSEVKFYKEKLAGAPDAVANQQKPAANPTAGPSIITTLDKPTDNDKLKGNKSAKYALVEYSDYDCPFCSRFHETAKTFFDQNQNDVMWVYRHFPLPQLHPDAQKKAEAAECVKQISGIDAFWQFTDAIFAGDETANDLAKIALEKAGVNSAEFTKCLDAGQGKAGVDTDVKSGTKAGVNGTPGNFILNIETGEAFVLKGAVPIDTLTNTLKMMKSN